MGRLFYNWVQHVFSRIVTVQGIFFFYLHNAAGICDSARVIKHNKTCIMVVFFVCNANNRNGYFFFLFVLNLKTKSNTKKTENNNSLHTPEKGWFVTEPQAATLRWESQQCPKLEWSKIWKCFLGSQYGLPPVFFLNFLWDHHIPQIPSQSKMAAEHGHQQLQRSETRAVCKNGVYLQRSVSCGVLIDSTMRLTFMTDIVNSLLKRDQRLNQ